LILWVVLFLVTGELSVKFAPRAAIAALITITAAAAAVLPFSVPALASPVPPAPSPGLIGTWTNAGGLKHILDIVISRSGTAVAVDAFEDCRQAVCEHGDVPGTVFGASVSSATGNSFQASWISGSDDTILLGTLDSGRHLPTLTVHEFVIHFRGIRANYTKTETFHPGKPITPTRVGTAVTRYPLGDSVPAANGFIGAWVNSSATSGEIAKIVLTRSGRRELAVNAFAKCPQGLCDRGKADGITFGREGPDSVVGRAFLAQYVSSVAEDLLHGTVNPAGTVLTVQTYTQFTDRSGRSNYLLTEKFKRG
jgi:hypothetical protein